MGTYTETYAAGQKTSLNSLHIQLNDLEIGLGHVMCKLNRHRKAMS